MSMFGLKFHFWHLKRWEVSLSTFFRIPESLTILLVSKTLIKIKSQKLKSLEHPSIHF